MTNRKSHRIGNENQSSITTVMQKQYDLQIALHLVDGEKFVGLFRIPFGLIFQSSNKFSLLIL
jgi:hypothetical protein